MDIEALRKQIKETDLLDNHLCENNTINQIDKLKDMITSLHEYKTDSIFFSHIPDSRKFNRYIEEYLDYVKYAFCKDNREILMITAIVPKKILNKIRKELDLKQ